jgi:hypothetical protein
MVGLFFKSLRISMRAEKIQNGTLWRERYLTIVAVAMIE